MKNNTLSYLITVSRDHIVPAKMLILGLKKKTKNEIVVVGNLEEKERSDFEILGVKYIDEDDIDYRGRLPKVQWKEKYRKFGWYKQMFIRLSIDTFMNTDQVVILDSEVFVFDNWSEKRLYDPQTNMPRSFYWVPEQRKSEWNYQMYRGAAYLLNFLPECKGIMEYANSDNYKRHISGVVLFSTRNVAKLWELLEKKTDLHKNIDDLFNKRDDLAFSDHDIYGLAVEYGLFQDTVPTKMYEGLLGWYDNHQDKDFLRFKKDAMWSMCQKYSEYKTVQEYYGFMQKTAKTLDKILPLLSKNEQPDHDLILDNFDNEKSVRHFNKYKRQLDFSARKRFKTMYGSLRLLVNSKVKNPTIVEIGTLRDINRGGGHSTYKFAEFCSRFSGKLYTVDILDEAIRHSKRNTAEFQPWINYVVSDSELFLKNFPGTIDLLYLDGLDSTPGKEKEASKKQLKEIKAALPHLSKHSVILLDDADLPEGGKTRLSSVYLTKKGFRLAVSGYQQLYVRDSKKPHQKPKGLELIKTLTKLNRRIINEKNR